MASSYILERRPSPGVEGVYRGGALGENIGQGFFSNMLKRDEMIRNLDLADATSQTAMLGELIKEANARGYGAYPVAINPQTGQAQQAAGPPSSPLPTGYYFGYNTPVEAYNRIWQRMRDYTINNPYYRYLQNKVGLYPRAGIGALGGQSEETE